MLVAANWPCHVCGGNLFDERALREFFDRFHSISHVFTMSGSSTSSNAGLRYFYNADASPIPPPLSLSRARFSPPPTLARNTSAAASSSTESAAVACDELRERVKLATESESPYRVRLERTKRVTPAISDFARSYRGTTKFLQR
mmetsp:Transcript_9565/g.30638  ORF Transcript_9565/g.30638 Transcript_9565/m.30638 type:complete len:144 (+) Transcript_9565:648-1079(+)